MGRVRGTPGQQTCWPTYSFSLPLSPLCPLPLSLLFLQTPRASRCQAEAGGHFQKLQKRLPSPEQRVIFFFFLQRVILRRRLWRLKSLGPKSLKASLAFRGISAANRQAGVQGSPSGWDERRAGGGQEPEGGQKQRATGPLAPAAGSHAPLSAGNVGRGDR